jgi:hypothetical protein
MSDDVNCPYCDAPIEICHDDGFGFEEGVKHEYECPSCRKTFVFETSISFYYEADKADCLNEGGEHDWKPTTTVPAWYTSMRCTMCDKERQPTPDEKIKYKIPERPN